MKTERIPKPTRRDLLEVYEFTKPTIEKMRGRRIKFSEFKCMVLKELQVMQKELDEGRIAPCKGCNVFPGVEQVCLGKGRCGHA